MRYVVAAVIITCAVLFPATWVLAQSSAELEEKAAILHTEAGTLVIEFFPDDAPQHVQNFLDLAQSGFYDETVFHRIIEGFMIQGGDPLTREGASTMDRWGTGGPEWVVPAEFNDIQHDRGIVSMARSTDPNSAGSQFFIVHRDSNFLDGEYTVFGRLATSESFETLDAIATMDTQRSLQNSGTDIPIDWNSAVIERVEIVDRNTIQDIIPWKEPERISNVSEGTIIDNTYTNTDLKIQFTIPEGWFPQSGSGTDPQEPDLIILGPRTGTFPATIYLLVEPANGKTLDDYIAEKSSSFQSMADSGVLTLLSESGTTVGGQDAYARIITSDIPSSSGPITSLKIIDTDFVSGEMIYTLTYLAEEADYDLFVDRYETLLDSVSFVDSEEPEPTSYAPEDSGGCLIATAAFGTELAPQVQQLRELRDGTILQTASGRAFMDSFNGLYYSFSPAIADLQREHEVLRETIKVIITPLLHTLSLLSYANADSEAEVMVYGLSIILLNAGLYVGAPASVLFAWRRYHRSSTSSRS